MAGRKVAKIDAESSVVTVINVFDVEPERQAELAGLLSSATEEVFQHQPGFISVSIHASPDGTRVVNYAQWASGKDVEQLMQNPQAQAAQKKVASVAKGASPGIYKVNSVHVAG